VVCVPGKVKGGDSDSLIAENPTPIRKGPSENQNRDIKTGEHIVMEPYESTGSYVCLALESIAGIAVTVVLADEVRMMTCKSQCVDILQFLLEDASRRSPCGIGPHHIGAFGEHHSSIGVHSGHGLR
jgi:hypothetical protein